MQGSVITPQWEEDNSQDFIDYGKYFVPDREIQINMHLRGNSACIGIRLYTGSLLWGRTPHACFVR